MLSTIQAVLPADKASSPIELWFEDEARVGQQGTQIRVWAIKGTRPRVIKQQQFQSAYIFDAVCPGQDQAVALILPQANKQMMAQYLKTLAEQLAPDHHAVVIMDRAPWHTTKQLEVPANITCVFLPPYSA